LKAEEEDAEDDEEEEDEDRMGCIWLDRYTINMCSCMIN